MKKQDIEIAKEFSTEVRRQYPEVDITSIRFVGITGQEVEISALPYNLEEAECARVFCNFEYALVNGIQSNFFVLFIDGNGRASTKMRVGGWLIQFDEPVTGGRPSPSRHCYLKHGDVCVDVCCQNSNVDSDFGTLWSFFFKVRSCASEEEIYRMAAPYSIGKVVYLYKIVRSGLE